MKNIHLIIIFLLLVTILLFTGCTDEKDEPHEDDEADEEIEERVVATFTPESRTCFQCNSPTIVDDYIYIGTSTRVIEGSDSVDYLSTIPDNFFYKMDLDLNIIWEYPLQKTMVDGGATLDSNNNIYFVTLSYSPTDVINPDGTMNYLTNVELYSLTNDGAFRWKKHITRDGESWKHGILNCAIGTDDTIYVIGSKLYAFYPDGSIKWQYPDNDYIIQYTRTSPIIDSDGNVYFVSQEPRENIGWQNTIKAYKFGPDSDGTPIWSITLRGESDGPGILYSTPSFLKDQKSFYAAVQTTIYRIDTETGDIIWSTIPKDATGQFKASPAVDGNDTLYFGTKANQDSKFYAVDSNASLLWMNPIGSDMYPSPFLGDDGNVYIGSETNEKGKFHAIDKETGEIQWSIGDTFPDFSFGSPVLINGHAYFGGNEVRADAPWEKAFFKIKVDANNYPSDAAWPRFHGSNENTGRKI